MGGPGGGRGTESRNPLDSINTYVSMKESKSPRCKLETSPTLRYINSYNEDT